MEFSVVNSPCVEITVRDTAGKNQLNTQFDKISIITKFLESQNSESSGKLGLDDKER